MTWLRVLQLRVVALTLAGSLGIFVASALRQDFSPQGFWTVETAAALVVGIDALFVLGGSLWATRGAYGGLAFGLGAASVVLFRVVPGSALSLPEAMPNQLVYAIVAVLSTAAYLTGFLLVHRRRGDLKTLGRLARDSPGSNA